MNLARQPAGATAIATVPAPHRALYGAGLLRVWADRVYARVLASHETASSRAAVLEFGRVIAAHGGSPEPPRLLSALPRTAGQGFSLRSDRMWFLRSHLVLNSAFFLATQNILDLDHSVEAAVAPYQSGRSGEVVTSAQLILARYPSAAESQRALTHFREAYLPEVRRGPGTLGVSETGVLRIEEGWMAYRAAGRALALAFGCPTSDLARVLVEHTLRNVETLEVGGDR